MPFPITLFFALDRVLSRLESFLLVSTLIVMLVFASLQVILRNFFYTGIEWGDVFARHLVLWVGFFGATLSTKEERHIRIDALLKVIPKKWHALIELFVETFCLIVTFLLFQAALKFVLDEKMAETVLIKKIPTWYFITIMPFGFAVISYRHFLRLITVLLKVGGKNVEELNREIIFPEHSELDISVKIKLK